MTAVNRVVESSRTDLTWWKEHCAPEKMTVGGTDCLGFHYGRKTGVTDMAVGDPACELHQEKSLGASRYNQ